MGMKYEIEIPPQLTQPLLLLAAETELSVEDIIKAALINCLQGGQDNA